MGFCLSQAFDKETIPHWLKFQKTDCQTYGRVLVGAGGSGNMSSHDDFERVRNGMHAMVFYSGSLINALALLARARAPGAWIIGCARAQW